MSNTLSVLFFGQLADITGSRRLTLYDVADTEALQTQLFTRFPLLKEARFVITVNRQVTRQRTAIDEQAEVALLPPFSGG